MKILRSQETLQQEVNRLREVAHQAEIKAAVAEARVGEIKNKLKSASS
jgi:hypothetical protein